MSDTNLEITPRWHGNSGTATWTAKVAEKIMAVNKFDSTKLDQREKFIADLATACPAANPVEIREQMLQKIGGRVEMSAESADQPGIADLLVNIALAEAELFHDSSNVGYARIKIAEHYENMPVRSKAFRLFLRRRLREEYELSAYGEAVQTAIEETEAKALFDGPLVQAHVRIAEDGGLIYLDLGDESWRHVIITASGWEFVEGKCDVLFIRPAGVLPLPLPERGGSIEELKQFLNVADDSDFILIKGFILQALRGRGPYPLLDIDGEQGSAKSTGQRIIRSLVDPNAAPLRSEPREPRDLVISANNSHMLAYDNLSHMPPWLSDGLCRMSTGGGFATRALWTDKDEVIFEAQRPVMFNGISDVATRSDLLDRCIRVTLSVIPEDKRKPESEIWREFNEVRPRIIGALLDAVSCGLKNQHLVKLDTLPRMADFGIWVVACLPLWDGQTFLKAYADNRKGANEAAIEASSVGVMVFNFVSNVKTWEGTSADLLGALEDLLPKNANGDRKFPKDWPKTARGLSSELRRIAPNLRAIGVAMTWPPRGQSRKLILERVGKQPSQPTQPTKTPIPASQGDLSGDDVASVEIDTSVAPTEPTADVAQPTAQKVRFYAENPVTVGHDGCVGESPSLSEDEEEVVI